MYSSGYWSANYYSSGIWGHDAEFFDEHGMIFGRFSVNDIIDEENSLGQLGVDNVQYGGVAYPFLYRNEMNVVIEDLFISFAQPSNPRLQLNWVSGLKGGGADTGVPNAVNEYDLQVGTSDATVLIDTRDMDFQKRVWTDFLDVCTWSSSTVSVQAVIRHGTAKSKMRASVPIDPRAIRYLPKQLTDVVIGEQSVVSDKAVQFKPGYNMELHTEQVVSDRGERVGRLEINAVPGAGLGKFPGCDANIGITALGNAFPNGYGDLLLGGDDCLTVRPELEFSATAAQVKPGRFLLEDLCTAPCECDDFKDVVEYATAVWNRYKVIAQRANAIRDSYHALRTELLAWRACAQENPLRAEVWKATPCAMGIGVGVCNVSEQCLSGATLKLRVTDGTDPIPDVAETNSVYQIQSTGNVTYNQVTEFSYIAGEYSVNLRDVEPNQMGFVFLRINLTDCEQQGNVEVSLDGDLSDSWSAVNDLVKPYAL